MTTTYTKGENFRKGSLLARGKGVFNMLDVSYKRGLNDDNSILEVSDTNDLDSRWRIYRKVLETEQKGRR